MFKYLAAILVLVGMFACTTPEVKQETLHAPFLNGDMTWADSLVLTMSLDEKIGQLLIYQPAAADSLAKAQLLELSSKGKIGGLVLEGYQLYEYIRLMDTLQSLSRIPLLNGSQQQVSLNNQFSDLTNLPSAATISAIVDDSLRALINTTYLHQLSNLGFNFCFTPSLNSNLEGDHFDFNAYESQPAAILDRSTAMLKEIRNQKMLSFAGDFKEYIDRTQDTVTVLDTLLHKYYHAVHNGVSGFYVDNSVFNIDTLAQLPPYFLEQYLREEINFDGLLISDWKEQPFNHMAYAGVDMFVVRDSFDDRFERVKALVAAEIISESAINNKVRKILQAKSWLGLDTIQPKIDDGLALDIMSVGFDRFEIRRLFEGGLTLVNNPAKQIPFVNTYREPFNIIQIGESDLESFQQYFSKYASYSLVQQPLTETGSYEPLEKPKYKRSKIILTLAQVDLFAERDSALLHSINALAAQTSVSVVNFGNPKNLLHFDTSVVLLQQYELNDWTQSFAAQLLFGGLQAPGKLPLALSERFPFGHGIDDTPITRLKYTVPEEVGIAAYQLVGIDALARKAIRDKATPGCQVLVAKEGKIIYSKSFGQHSFESGRLVQQSDLYDLASITKVAATTLGIMKLYDQEKVQLKQPLKSLIAIDEASRIKNIKIRDLLTHQSGLQSNMPIARYILDKDSTGTRCVGPFCNVQKGAYTIQIADSFYMDPKYRDSIWLDVFDIKPYKRKRYRYSDVNFNLLMRVLEERSGKTIDEYMSRYFYQPLNLHGLTYTPRKKFKKRNIIPTTIEERFRKQMIHGYVHDESAALLGGAAGNAGLFGNAESLAPLMQLLLNRGAYGGRSYLQPKTVDLFTKQQRGTRRGLGFDVKTKTGRNACAADASDKTFGHTGFTGTCVWVDPETELVFIFLANRIHPSVKNRKLFKDKVRARMHSLVYEALNTYPEQPVEPGVEEEPIVRAAIE